jgi:hypothetical protein
MWEIHIGNSALCGVLVFYSGLLKIKNCISARLSGPKAKRGEIKYGKMNVVVPSALKNLFPGCACVGDS